MLIREKVRSAASFNDATLITPLTFDLNSREPASVLLRTAALIALTNRENQNHAVEEYFKVLPIYDCLSVFRADFFNDRVVDDIELVIANNELSVAGKTANNFTTFLGQDAVARKNDGWPAVLCDLPQEALTTQLIFDHNNNAVTHNNPNNANITFFDEVNIIHNVHKEIVRYQRCKPNPLPLPLVVDTAFSEPSTTIKIQDSGNFGKTLVENWGAYDGTVKTINACIELRRAFQARAPIDVGQLNTLYFRDLYRLECIREPASLIANPMFFDLASSNGNVGYKTIYKSNNNNYDVYSFGSIAKKMPMAPQGSVNESRSLWNSMVNNIAIYYRYDYAPIMVTGYVDLAKRENNLLFNWLLNLSNLTENIRPILEQAISGQGTQKGLITTDVNWVAVGVDTYERIGVNNIKVRLTFRLHSSLIATDVSITAFPLVLINQLLLDWYNVDIGIPIGGQNPNIQINLKLR